MALNYVEPFDGFALTFNLKLEKMELMARATKLTTDRHLYLSRNRIESRNMMWGQCIRAAALSAACVIRLGVYGIDRGSALVFSAVCHVTQFFPITLTGLYNTWRAHLRLSELSGERFS